MTTTKQSEADRGAPWGGAHDLPLKPIRPYWDGYHRFCTDHGEYKIHQKISNGTAYAGYTPNGSNDIGARAINEEGGECPPRSPFLFADEKAATVAIKKHHRNILKSLRAAKKGK